MTDSSQTVIQQIHESTAKKGPAGLRRMGRLLSLLGNPEESFQIFHVAGTNGKGSISAYLTRIMMEAGYRVGTFTSPHVMEYNERFTVQGIPIADEDFARIGERVLAENDRLAEEGLGYLSEFEILTAISYLYFSEQNVDFMVSEVGLGGIIDSTNTIRKPVVSVIAQIGRDHEAMLGDTLEEIAWNKAGIIKEGVPVISESPEPEVRKVIREEAEKKHADFTDTSQIPYQIRYCGVSQFFDASILGVDYRGVELSMTGDHQVRNAIAAIAAIRKAEENGKITVSEEQLRRGLKSARVMGRFEILRENPTVIMDGAHNPNGIRAGMAAFRRYLSGRPAAEQQLIVFGCFKDKDYREMLEELAKAPESTDFIITEPESDRALDCETAASILRRLGRECVAISDEAEAYQAAESEGADVVFFVGSIYLVGNARKIFKVKGWTQHV